jgi:hypothetical protein
MVTSNYFSLIVLTTCHFLALDKKALAILAIVEILFKILNYIVAQVPYGHERYVNCIINIHIGTQFINV